MAGSTAAGWARPNEIRVHSGPPQLAVRLVSALLALAVAGVHVADQGSITAFNSPPDWLGWAYRFIEVGGVLTAIALLLPRSRRLGWTAGVLLGVGPLLGYLASRSIGIPGDHADVGNWGYWVGTESLIVETALVTLSASMLLPWGEAFMIRFRSSRRGGVGRPSLDMRPPRSVSAEQRRTM